MPKKNARHLWQYRWWEYALWAPCMALSFWICFFLTPESWKAIYHGLVMGLTADVLWFSLISELEHYGKG